MSDITVGKDEAAAISELREKTIELVIAAGQLAIGKHVLLEELSSIKVQEDKFLSDYKALQVQEDKLVAEMTEKYGPGSYDLETEKFIPKQ